MLGTTLSLFVVATAGLAPRQSPSASFELVPAPVPLWGSEAKAVSADGSTVVGNWNSLGNESCFVWHNGAAPRTVAVPPDVHLFDPNDVSADGTVVVGLAYREQQEAKAVRWQESGTSGILQFAGEDEIAACPTMGRWCRECGSDRTPKAGWSVPLCSSTPALRRPPSAFLQPKRTQAPSTCQATAM